MPFIKAKCPQCGRTAESEREFDIAGETVTSLKCGHFMRRSQLSTSNGGPESVISLDHKKLYPFQCEGVRFVEKSGGRALIGDEMGLGKTVQATATIALHPEMKPVAYFVKATLKIQWSHEIMRWVSKSDDEDDLEMAQVIETSKDKMLPGVNHYIFSFDLLRRFKNGSLAEQFRKRGIKTIVIDECQHIKNPQSARTVAVKELASQTGVQNILALSGKAIKNNAAEYFSVLNILKPEKFSTYSQFIYNDCQSYWTGYGYKVGGLKNPKKFSEDTKSFIIRRERKEVMPELPLVDRRFYFCELGVDVEQEYKDTFVNFRNDYYSSGGSMQPGEDGGGILAYLSRMRHITGRAKVEPCFEFVKDFLESTDRKLTVFVHHKDVGQKLYDKIRAYCAGESEEDEESNGDGKAKSKVAVIDYIPKQRFQSPIMLTAELNSQQRFEVVEAFMKTDQNAPRVLVASTLASGEGLNLQKCSDCILLERQWNPANEEQAESRFIRIGQEAESVMATYFVAIGTVDEFFAKIVEEKREIVDKTLGSKEVVKWNESSLMKELAEVLASQGGKMWGW